MAIRKEYLINSILVIALLLSVGTLVWGVLLVINGKDGTWYLKSGAVLTLISSMWTIVANVKKKEE